MSRIASFEEFWPFYLDQHRDARCRWMHFFGTLGIVGALAVGFLRADDPVRVSGHLVLMSALMIAGSRLEARRNTAPLMLLALVVGVSASPIELASGLVWAYGLAWVSHFFIEKNRPATFSYPLWSVAGDFRMFGRMVRGQLWSGEPQESLDPPHAPA